MFNVEMFKKIYPEFYSSPLTDGDIIKWFFIFIFPFLFAYLYIRFFEHKIILIKNKIKLYLSYF